MDGLIVGSKCLSAEMLKTIQLRVSGNDPCGQGRRTLMRLTTLLDRRGRTSVPNGRRHG